MIKIISNHTGSRANRHESFNVYEPSTYCVVHDDTVIDVIMPIKCDGAYINSALRGQLFNAWQAVNAGIIKQYFRDIRLAVIKYYTPLK